MISGIESTTRNRVLVVGCQNHTTAIVEQLRTHANDWSVATCDTYLSAIADLAQRPARAALVLVDPAVTQLDSALAGLRDAAGDDTRLILCCSPECEPIARSVLRCGADDYILYPLDTAEVTAAIGLPQEAPRTNPRLTEAPAASMEEFVQLASVLTHLDDTPVSVLERIASMVRSALFAKGATVVVEGAVGMAGEPISEPVLSAPLTGPQGVLGHLSLAQRAHDAYTPSDVKKLTHYAAVVGHVLNAASQQRRLGRLAVTDECSGLPNRRYFNERVDEILRRASAEQFHVTVLLFDVDDFKTYNDQYGHDVGDDIIRTTGELFRKHCREQDIVARYGGDEFAVCFWDPEGPRVAGSKVPNSALVVLDRVKEALQTEDVAHLGPSGVGRLTISGGVATYPWDGTGREELVKKADDALLAAKRAGKNRIFLIGEGDSPPGISS